MRYAKQLFHREGQHFYNTQQSYDLSDIKILHVGIDTLKPLYEGLIKQEILQEIESTYEGGFNSTIKIQETEWGISKSSSKSGYQWILKNLDIGYTVLLKSFYAEAGLRASHLKLEISPHAIIGYSLAQVRQKALEIANLFIYQTSEKAVAVHIAVDVKGVQLPQDFEYALVTKSKRVMKFNGISDAEMKLAEVACIYGRNETYTFGNASSLQFSTYDKINESIKGDKIGFWEEIWQRVPSTDDFMEPEYKPGDEVRRFEFRFHHSVIQEFCYGTQGSDGNHIQIHNIEQLGPHLTALWQYALNNFRYQHSDRYIHPFWQLLMEDVTFYPPVADLVYKRAKKPATQASKRNVALFMGNYLKLMARKRIKVEHVLKNLLNSDLESDLMDYFGLWGPDGREALKIVLCDFVTQRLQQHYLNGVAA